MNAPYENPDEHLNALPSIAPAVDDLVPAEAVPDSVAGLMPGALDDAFDPWNHHEGADPDPDDIGGFHVEASDGKVGVVDAVSHSVDDGRLLVDIGHLIFGRTVAVPATSVASIDRDARIVHLDVTKEEVKACQTVSDPVAEANAQS